ncbi:ankyrin repeat protein, putative [Trichomonas vaginalis G3]|uniref:Ankyrin repeat protein, putative n=1 Tax=Trichomonas vaginalis (strain ATCC PRA-98 / G3) TaxID=412133 RepID=A2G4B9_TRIV3|nr:spectrin binding [Trichomonas vaginalis G3]EAX88000.1 ankyrin repeat protein, putative [Trichomonas vaginalis G3]KAI5485761.1 spectrin binding [Trichomonas vaginalis G3]|eukprot:XP_001300930.1 ankyrin repeat protein [Trichomonas vaginalis G3]
MSECLKEKRPNRNCMINAIISHNIDFVSYLMNQYHIDLNLRCCTIYNNLHAFLVYFDITNDINNCFVYSPCFHLQSLCEYFINYGANINATNEEKMTALHFVIKNNNKEIAYNLCKYFISHGADINASNNVGETVLHIAVDRNYKKCVELFISNDANINVQNFIGETPLHYAAAKNNTEIAEILITNRANVNITSQCGDTALHIAEINECEKMIKLLKSRGADMFFSSPFSFSTFQGWF